MVFVLFCSLAVDCSFGSRAVLDALFVWWAVDCQATGGGVFVSTIALPRDQTRTTFKGTEAGTSLLLLALVVAAAVVRHAGRYVE